MLTTTPRSKDDVAVINGHSWSAGGGTSPAHHLTTPSTSYAAAAHPEDLVLTTGASAIQTVNSTTVSLASQVFDGLLPPRLCLGLYDVFIALFLVLLILLTIFGNVLVVLSVFVYKRMRTFTNILLTSLATADLLVGLIVMPMSLLDLLHRHQWPLGKFLCGVWATSDVLLCTASILNLCVISLDRYMAITSPLKYPRTRSRKMAAGLLSAVWATSVIICTPPWLVQGWGLFDSLNHYPSGAHQNFTCGYSASVPYRIYSALGSFYIPLFVMLSVYFKIFRVANERESLMRQSVGTCRLSNRLAKNQQEKSIRNNNYRSQTAPTGRMRVQVNNTGRINYSVRPAEYSNKLDSRFESRLDSTDMDDTSPPNGDSIEVSAATTIGVMMPHLLPSSAHFHSNHSTPVHTQHSQITDTTTHNMSASLINNSMTSPTGSQKDAVLPGSTLTPRKSMERECHSLADLCNSVQPTPHRKTTEVMVTPCTEVPALAKRAQTAQARLQPNNLIKNAHEHYQINGPGKVVRGSKEKMVYLRERKALKTIGIVVLGFIICWMPFFIMYLIEVFFVKFAATELFRISMELFLWLGYSNSVLNPIIYTMYNGDFRRCFRDLLSFGCVQHHRRTMSVKKLHQQSTIF